MFRDRHFHRTGRWHRSGSATDTTAPTFLDVTEETPTANTIFINWSLDEGATGYIEYGSTTGYGSETAFEDAYLTYHRQQITGLSAGTTYYYRITSVDASGNAATYTGDFTTSGAATFTSSTYGPAIRGRGKGNMQVRYESRGTYIGQRFKARIGGAVQEIRAQYTNRVYSYGGGDGGIIRIGLQAVDATGFPDGTWLDYEDIPTPITTSAIAGWRAVMSSEPVLTQGETYCVTYQNVHPDPTNNWSSLNQMTNADAVAPQDPLQPYFPDDEAMVVQSGQYDSGWEEVPFFVPCFDLQYVAGGHEGVSAISGRTYETDPGNIGIVNSGSKGRWSFTLPAGKPNMDAVAVNWWMRHWSGTANATVDVHVNGASQATGTFTTSGAVLAGTYPDWQRAVLSGTVTITAGDFVEVFCEVASGEYQLPTVLYRDASTTSADQMESFPYSEGGGTNPFRADDGATGTTPAYAAWYAHSAYGAYFEIA